MRHCRQWGWLVLAVFCFGVTPKVSADDSAKTILILGDSLAAGYGVDPDEAWPALLQKKIDAAGLNYQIVNAGVSGNTTADGLQRLNWLLKRPFDVLLLELGGNDGLRGLDTGMIKTNLQAIIDKTRQKYPSIKIIVAGMKMPATLGPDYTGAFEKVFPEIARQNHAALIPFLLAGVGGNPDLNLPDGIHPLPAGHKIVADNVWKILQPELR